MTSESAITAAILGELVPELEYATPVLVERWERGSPLVGKSSPTDPGFETGALDSVLLELFQSLLPYVKLVLSWGVLRVIQAWIAGERESRRQIELLARLNVLLTENVRTRQMVETIAELLARHEGAAVSIDDILRTIADAASRIANAHEASEAE